jgi:hypothetical protein
VIAISARSPVGRRRIIGKDMQYPFSQDPEVFRSLRSSS